MHAHSQTHTGSAVQMPLMLQKEKGDSEQPSGVPLWTADSMRPMDVVPPPPGEMMDATHGVVEKDSLGKNKNIYCGEKR